MGKNSWWKVEEGTALLFIVKVIIALQVSAPPFACLKSKRLDNVTGSEVMLRVLHRVTHQGQPQKCERIGALAGRSPCILSCASYNLPCADSFKHRLREFRQEGSTLTRDTLCTLQVVIAGYFVFKLISLFISAFRSAYVEVPACQMRRCLPILL